VATQLVATRVVLSPVELADKLDVIAANFPPKVSTVTTFLPEL
jgi:hypothetical protein